MTSESIYTPQISPGNPGQTSVFSIAFSRDGESWSEHIDLTSLLEEVLTAEGQRVSRHGEWLQTAEDIWLLPRLLSWELCPDGTGRSSTTIQVSHGTLAPAGCFEFQHAASHADAADAFRSGFTQWARTDAAALRESTSAAASGCMSMTMDFPAKADHPELHRRVVFGPASHYMASPQAQTACHADDGNACEDDGENGEHGFCPCCLLTQSIEAFLPVLESSGFAAIRLYAARDDDGEIHADCRVNGEDYANGKTALMDYVKTWPAMGFEFRKQLVVVHNVA